MRSLKDSCLDRCHQTQPQSRRVLARCRYCMCPVAGIKKAELESCEARTWTLHGQPPAKYSNESCIFDQMGMKRRPHMNYGYQCCQI